MKIWNKRRVSSKNSIRMYLNGWIIATKPTHTKKDTNWEGERARECKDFFSNKWKLKPFPLTVSNFERNELHFEPPQTDRQADRYPKPTNKTKLKTCNAAEG